MYGPNWPFLLTYESHDMRHTVFLWVEVLSADPRDLGRHIMNGLLISLVNRPLDMRLKCSCLIIHIGRRSLSQCQSMRRYIQFFALLIPKSSQQCHLSMS